MLLDAFLNARTSYSFSGVHDQGVGLSEQITEVGWQSVAPQKKSKLLFII